MIERLVDVLMGEDSGKYPYKAAEAVLRAMREPTEAMIEAARRNIWEYEQTDETIRSTVIGVWQDMIDAALKCP